MERPHCCARTRHASTRSSSGCAQRVTSERALPAAALAIARLGRADSDRYLQPGCADKPRQRLLPGIGDQADLRHGVHAARRGRLGWAAPAHRGFRAPLAQGRQGEDHAVACADPLIGRARLAARDDPAAAADSRADHRPGHRVAPRLRARHALRIQQRLVLPAGADHGAAVRSELHPLPRRAAATAAGHGDDVRSAPPRAPDRDRRERRRRQRLCALLHGPLAGQDGPARRWPLRHTRRPVALWIRASAAEGRW